MCHRTWRTIRAEVSDGCSLRCLTFNRVLRDRGLRATRSVAVILARPFKAGVKVTGANLRRVSDAMNRLTVLSVCSFRRCATENSIGWRGNPALKGQQYT